jgi:putative ABC transport system ATP-binding protein
MRAKSPKFAFYKRHESEITCKVEALKIGLEKYINRPLFNLSGGQRQIVAMLIAVESDRKVLLLDEHTSALDPKMQTLLMDYTDKAVASSKMTTVMITHKMDDAIRYGNRLIILNKGKIVLDVTGSKKSELTANKLLALFHRYEDQNLMSEES